MLAQDLGLTRAAACRIEGGGASGHLAVQAGAARIMAGLSRIVAVVGVDATASTLPGDALRMLYGRSLDAMTDGPTGVTATQGYALSWQVFAAGRGLGDDDLARVTIAHRAQAMANPGSASAAPAQPGRDRRRTDDRFALPAAALLATERRGGGGYPGRPGRAARRAPGGGADRGRWARQLTGRLAARPDPGRFMAKTRAMQAAFTMAGIGADRIGLAEVYDPYAGAALQALEALGLSDRPGADLADGRFGRDGALPVNLSGGLLGQGAAPGATGVAQIATCALLLEGRYHPQAQPARPPTFALADTHGGICSNAAVTILAQAEAA